MRDGVGESLELGFGHAEKSFDGRRVLVAGFQPLVLPNKLIFQHGRGSKYFCCSMSGFGNESNQAFSLHLPTVGIEIQKFYKFCAVPKSSLLWVVDTQKGFKAFAVK